MTTTDMKRYTSLKSNLFSSHSSSIVSQNLVYMQMSHHYRRLLNAKSNVDSSQPRSFRTQERARYSQRVLHFDTSQSSFVEEPSPSEMELVDKIVYDNKHRPDVIYRDLLAGTNNHNHRYPSAPSRHDCTRPRMVTERPKQNQRYQQIYTPRITKKPTPSDLIDRHSDDFECAARYKPRILKSTAQSRVRDLKVYHPPRRKPQVEETEEWDIIQTEVQQQHEDERVMEDEVWLQTQTLQKDIELHRPLCVQCQREITLEQPSSKVSIGSRDSAYNGGVSSGGESRGPTPEQINLANLSTNTARCEECPSHVPEKVYDRTEYVVPSNINTRCHKDRSSSSSRKQPVELTTARKVHLDRRTSRPSSCSCSPTRQCRRNFNHIASTDKRVPGLDDGVVRDDVRYAAFSQQITADILSREILSNKGINKVFQRHMEENMEFLDMTLMQAEIDLLRVQLDLGGIDEYSETSNPPILGSDIRSNNKKDIHSSPLDRSNNSCYKVSLPVSTSGGNNPSNVLYPTSPSSTRYRTLAVRNQLVHAGDSSQNAESNQNGLQLSPFEISSPNVVSTEMQTDIYSKDLPLEEIVGSSSDTSADAGSLKIAIKEILEQILTDNISSIIEDNNLDVDNEMDNVPNDNEHSKESERSLSQEELNDMAVVYETENVPSDSDDSMKFVLSNLENDESQRSLPEDELNNMAVDNEINNVPSDSNDSVQSVLSDLEKEESKRLSTVVNASGFRDSWVSKGSSNSSGISSSKVPIGEDLTADTSSSGTQTRCCFIKRKKKTKDAPSIKNKTRLNQNEDEVAATSSLAKHSSNHNTIDTTDTSEHLENVRKLKEDSWVAMEESKENNASNSSINSSKISGLAVSETPRVRKVSDQSSRRRSINMEVMSSSSSSSNISPAPRNFREEVRQSFEARQNKSFSKSESD